VASNEQENVLLQCYLKNKTNKMCYEIKFELTFVNDQKVLIISVLKKISIF
jgi:hypothetical protein